MIPTPSIKHLTRLDFRHVYEPAEDTFILLDALEQDADTLRDNLSPKVIVEIGSGSGCVSAFVSRLFGDSQSAYICTDINPIAVDATARTGKANNASLEPILTSTVSALASRVQGTRHGLVDLLFFNPPYVPTTAEEEAQAQENCAIAGAWAGGWTGTKLLEQLIDDVAERGKGGIETLLSSGGHFYFVAIRQNDPKALVARLQARGLGAEMVMQRRAGREHLFVIRAVRASHQN